MKLFVRARTLLIAVLVLATAVQMVGAKTIYVPDDYSTIQDAVDSASNGDVIVVRDGNYKENVDVDVSVTITSENGSAGCVVKASKSSDDVFEVSADGVKIIGLSITGATGNKKAGVRIEKVDDCAVKDCVIWNCNLGVYVRGTSGNTAKNSGIINCSISECNSGIKISGKGCTGCKILSNAIFNCFSHGVLLVNADENEIKKNDISNNEFGIYLQNADSNNISCNWIHKNDIGLYLSDTGGSSVKNIISYNNIIQNGQFNSTTGGYEWLLYNDQSAEVDATYNYWGLFTNKSIDASIYDDNENLNSGEVNFYPFSTNSVPSAPVPELTTLLLVSAGVAVVCRRFIIYNKKL